MNITVTFTDCAGMEIPEGASITFENVSDYQVNTPVDLENIDCATAGCKGCNATHRRRTGTSHLHLEATGSGERGPQWKLPEAVT